MPTSSIFNPTSEKLGILSRRSFLLTTGKIALLGTLGARLYHLQVKDGSKYRDLAEGNRIRLIPVLPRRGSIKDRDGVVLAEGLPRYQLLFSPVKGQDKKENFLQIAKTINLPADATAEFLKKIDDPATEYPFVVDNFMAWENIAKIKVKSRDLKGADVTFFEQRSYPYSGEVAHVTGYTGKISVFSEENKRIFGEILKHPDLRVGQTGIEYSMQDKLYGEPGYTEVETDAHGNSIKDLSYDAPEKGDDVKLTIDIDLQQQLHKLLKGKGGLKGEGGSGVLIDIETGDILAMASVPDFDPNQFAAGIKKEQLQELYKNPDKPLKNKTISVTYPPGSSFKPIVATAALQDNIINAQTTFFCPGHYDFAGRSYACWKKEGHGVMNLQTALAQSCNVFFYQVGALVGIDRISYYAHKYGYGQKVGIELPGEEPGVIPDSRWKLKTLKEPWYKGETLSAAIGQGYVNITPLQLAVAVARISSGRNVIPRLVMEDNEPPKAFEPLSGVSSQVLDVVHGGMYAVVNDPSGTAYRVRIQVPGMEMAGKTGSAQVKGINHNIKISKAQADRDTHAIFMGYAPFHKPKFAAGIIVEYGGHGASSAAPVASQLLLYAQQKLAGKTNT